MAKKLAVATVEDFDPTLGFTLLRVRTEHLKRIRYVDLTLDRTLTVIGGDNAQGKTSFLDSIKWCLGGKAVIEMNPIHEGKQRGYVTCDFGIGETVKLSVTRKILKVGEDDWTTDIDIEVPGFLPPSKVQNFLDKLAGEQSFDPLTFDTMDPKAQVETMKRFSKFDFKANAAVRKDTYDKRTAKNGDLKRAETNLAAITVSDTAPSEHVDEDALTRELSDAGTLNSQTAVRRTKRENMAARVTEQREDAAAELGKIDADLAQVRVVNAGEVAKLEDELRLLQERLKALQTTGLEDALAAARKVREDEAARLNREADAMASRLESADPLPPLVDVEAIEARIKVARESNRVLNDWKVQDERRKALKAEVEKFTAESDALTAKIAECDHAHADAIAKADLPIDGLGLGDDVVTLNQKPWQQASEAERYEASTAIGMALNPTLKFVLIRHASGVGSKIRQRIQELAEPRGYHVLLEVLDETGANSHVFIEDGMIKKIDGQDIPAQSPPAKVQKELAAPAAAAAPGSEQTDLTTPAGETTAEAPAPEAKAKRRQWRGPGAPTGDAA